MSTSLVTVFAVLFARLLAPRGSRTLFTANRPCTPAAVLVVLAAFCPEME
ncbi:MAG: hypothetical protein IRZ07_30205 [Microbispora sp.]|nr:hypothetical protein [Microbispora sp.]